MPKILDTYCDICGEVGETRYIPLFTIGSEGTRLCHGCEMLVVGFIRVETRKSQKRRIAKHKEKTCP